MKNNASHSEITGKASLIAFTIIPLVSSSALAFYVLKNQELIGDFSLLQWVYTSLALALTSALAISPPTFLAIIMGFFLGWSSVALLILINLLAIILIYILYKTLDFSWIENRILILPKVAGILEKIRAQELKFIFFTKLSPVFPFALTNLIFAISGAKFKNIIWGGFLGMIPRTLLAVYVGTKAGELQQLVENPNQGSLNQILIPGLIIISIWGMMRVIKKTTKA